MDVKMKKKLLNVISQRKRENEYRLSTISGVKNLSRADLDMIELYVKTDGRGMVEPRGAVKEVLDKFGFVHLKY